MFAFSQVGEESLIDWFSEAIVAEFFEWNFMVHCVKRFLEVEKIPTHITEPVSRMAQITSVMQIKACKVEYLVIKSNWS